MVSDEQLAGDRMILRRRKGRRRLSGVEFAATPSLEWKLWGGDLRRRHGGVAPALVSSRKLAAALWRLTAKIDGNGRIRWQPGVFDRLQQLCSSMPIGKFAMEEVTKWDYSHTKVPDHDSYFCSRRKHQEIATTSAAYARQAELLKTRRCVNELEDDRLCSRMNIKYCMKKLNEDAEKEKMYSIVKYLKDAVIKERKNRKRIEIANGKLLHDIASTKLSASKLMMSIEKEKKAIEFFKDVCDKLAKEAEDNKYEIDALRNQHKRIQEEVEESRKMLQITQLWREERAQMKLVDAKLILEKKYAEINNLILNLEALLKNSNSSDDVSLLSKAQVLRKVFSVKQIQSNETVTQGEAHRVMPRAKDTFKKVPVDGSRSLSNRTLASTVSVASSQRVIREGNTEARDTLCQSPYPSEHKNPHVVRAMKGHIKWPRGTRRHGLTTTKVLEAKLQSQKMLLRNVLKQKS